MNASKLLPLWMSASKLRNRSCSWAHTSLMHERMLLRAQSFLLMGLDSRERVRAGEAAPAPGLEAALMLPGLLDAARACWAHMASLPCCSEAHTGVSLALGSMGVGWVICLTGVVQGLGAACMRDSLIAAHWHAAPSHSPQ